MTGRKTRPKLIVAAMLISTFMAAVEVTVISIAMPTIVAKLGGFSLFSWTFGIYLLTQAVMTPLYGRLADSFGRKTVYLWSTALFLLGSLLCGLSWSMESLILFRAIQGIGGGALAPLATTIIGDVCKPEDRARIMGYGSGIWGIAALAGPLLGAFFVNTLGWPFVFWVNLPIGIITMIMVIRFLHEPASGKSGAPIDLLGAGLLILGIGAMMVALVQFETLLAWELAVLLIITLFALAGFALRERQLLHPMLPLHLMTRPVILAAQASALLAGGILIGLTAFLPAWVQGVEGGSALQSGIVLGVLTVAWTAATMTIGRAVGRSRDRVIAIGAGLVMVAASIGLLFVSRGQGLMLLYVVCVPLGAGMGLTSLVFTIAVQSGVAHVDRGRATALFYFSRLIGQALGAAAFGGVLNSGLAGAGTHDALRALVSPARRAALSPMDLDRLTGLLGAALHGVFILSAVLAVGALLAALLVPRQRVNR
ncbi:MFS transporter [Acidisoma cladoniae]|jgi:multidrug resistance protein|uniref:MFS transporter n=1 Tax=Acidisoma cladoniae TaxID=3040935 RepID=UPI00254D83A5|nr:MFS transporter [Acidisoma sp. PAMC 29798]